MNQNKTEIVISALNETQAAFRQLQDALKGLDKDLGQIRRTGDQVSSSVKNSFGRMNDSVSQFRAVIATIGAGLVLKGFIDAANQVERATIGLATTARYSGVAFSEAKAAAVSLAEDGLMSLAEASQGLQNLLSRGFNLQESINLMNRFKDSAAFNRQASYEFGQAVVSATEGLKNENSILVDNAGVTKNVSIMWKEYAAQQGKSVEQLTQAEKRHAEYNGILKETEGQLGNAARMTETFAGQQARLNQELFNFRATAGRELMPVFTDIAKGITPVISLLKQFVGDFEIAVVRLAGFVDKAKVVMSTAYNPFKLFSKDARFAAGRQLNEISQNVDETSLDIIKRFGGGGELNIGADTGKRRTDFVLPPNPKSASAAARKSATEAKRQLADLQRELAEARKPGGLYEWAEINEANQAIANFSPKFQAPKLDLSAPRSLGVDLSLKSLEQQEEEKKLLDDIAARKRQIAESEAQYQLSLVDTAEVYHEINAATADDRRLEINRQLLASYEESLAAMDKAADPAGWFAQAEAIEQARKKVLELKQAVAANQGGVLYGLQQGLKEYSANITDVATQVSQSVQTTFKGMEDALVGFVTEGKFQFSDLVKSILADLARLTIQKTITNNLSSLFSGLIGMFGGGLGSNVDVNNWGGLPGGLMSNALGGVYASPSLSAYSGAVVDKPTFFKFAYGGALGVMGEGRDPEGIFPLARDRSGKLGVRAVGGSQSLTINIPLTVEGSKQLASELRADIEGLVEKKLRRHS